RKSVEEIDVNSPKITYLDIIEKHFEREAQATKIFATDFQISSDNNSDNNIKRQKTNDNEFELHLCSSWSGQDIEKYIVDLGWKSMFALCEQGTSNLNAIIP
ncbi:11276_t:CDS:2, partial [Entrophospora sp. SA101]